MRYLKVIKNLDSLMIDSIYEKDRPYSIGILNHIKDKNEFTKIHLAVNKCGISAKFIVIVT